MGIVIRDKDMVSVLTKLRGKFSGTLVISVLLLFLMNGAAVSSAATSINGSQSPSATTFPNGSDLQASEVEIPAQSDWIDQGVVLTRGAPGSWDVRFHGQFSPCAVVKTDGTYFLYYIGADGNRADDGGPRHRALGVATSTDGINFQKYSGNPIITFIPNPNLAPAYHEEEGIFTCGATKNDQGQILLYYGAMTAFEPSQVWDDARLAISDDGFNFTDVGIVIDHDCAKSNPRVWGCGDELDPFGAFEYNGTWYLYYSVGNGVDFSGNNLKFDLGLAWGDSPDNMPNTVEVISASDLIYGGGDPIEIGGNKVALFLARRPLSKETLKIEVRTAFKDDPANLSGAIQTYNFGGEVNNFVVYLDQEAGKWLMYYTSPLTSAMPAPPDGDIRLKTAFAAGGDATPPTAPSNLAASNVTESSITLNWAAAEDAESGISKYMVYYLDGSFVGQSSNTTFVDSGLSESTQYSYRVLALNGAQLEGPLSDAVSATTLSDATPPTVVKVTAAGNPNSVTVIFSERMEKTGAENSANYQIDSGVAVTAASLDADETTLTLTTTDLVKDIEYTLTVNNVVDASGGANPIAANTTATFNYVDTLIIDNVWPSNYSVGVLQTGAMVFTDRPFKFGVLPEALDGAAYIMTANNDKQSTADPFVSFDVNQDVTIYVAHDDRISNKPQWLQSFTNTGLSLIIFEDSHSLWSKAYTAGTVSLGGNSGTSDTSMYSVIISNDEPFTLPSTVAVAVQSSAAVAGNTVSIPVVIDAAPTGISSFRAHVTLTNPSIAEILGVTLPNGFSIDQLDQISTSEIIVTAVDDGQGIESGDTNMTLFTISIKALSAGDTAVNLALESLKDDNGLETERTIQNGTLSVTALIYPTLPEMERPVQDLDGDGKAEDINGNGRLDFSDLVTLFKYFNSPEVQNNIALFDFNSNGVVDLADVTALFNELVDLGG